MPAGEVKATCPAPEPTRSKTAVSAFLKPNPFLQLGTGFVSDGAELPCETLSVLKIGGFDAQTHDCHEACGVFAGWDSLPEPVPDGEVAEREAKLFEPSLVEAHVTDLIKTDPDEPTPELGFPIGEGQEGPAHELSGLEFMMPKGVQQAGSLARALQAFVAAAVGLSWTQARRTTRAGRRVPEGRFTQAVGRLRRGLLFIEI